MAIVIGDKQTVEPWNPHAGRGCAYIDRDTSSTWEKGFTFNVRVPDWIEGKLIVMKSRSKLPIQRVWNSNLISQTDSETSITLAKYPGGDEILPGSDKTSEHNNEFGVMGNGPLPDGIEFVCPGPPLPPNPPPPSPTPPHRPTPSPPPPYPPPTPITSPSPHPPPSPCPPPPPPPRPFTPPTSTLIGSVSGSSRDVPPFNTILAMTGFSTLAAVGGYFIALHLCFKKPPRPVRRAEAGDDDEDDEDEDDEDEDEDEDDEDDEEDTKKSRK